MIKVLYLPLNTAEIKQTGMYDAFKNNKCKLDIFDYHHAELKKNRGAPATSRAFVEKAVQLKPDLIHMQLQFTNIIQADALKEIKRKLPKTIITNWTGDVRDYVPRYFITISNVVDHSLISSSGQVPMYIAAGCKNVKYWQIGYNPKLYFPKNHKKYDYDVVFIGNYFGKTFPGSVERVNVLRALKNAFGARFCLLGGGWSPEFGKTTSVPQHKVNDVYNSSVCVVSISNFNTIADYFSDRFLMCLASGRPTISYNFPNIHKYVNNNTSALVASSPAHFVKRVNWCKANPVEASAVGAAGAKVALTQNSYFKRVEELLKMVKLNA